MKQYGRVEILIGPSWNLEYSSHNRQKKKKKSACSISVILFSVIQKCNNERLLTLYFWTLKSTSSAFSLYHQGTMQQGHSFESIAFLMRNAPKKGSLSLLNESLSEQKSSCLLIREGSSFNTCTAATWRAVYYSAKCYRWCYNKVSISLGKQCNLKKKKSLSSSLSVLHASADH